MMILQSDHHSEQVLAALQNKKGCDILLIGNDNISSHSDSLWILSPLVRSIIDSLKNVEGNKIIIPDFSCEDIMRALDIIEGKDRHPEELVFFNSATKYLLKSLGIDLENTQTFNTNTADIWEDCGDGEIEKDHSEDVPSASEVKVEREDVDDEVNIQEMLLADLDLDPSDDEEDTEQDDVAVDELRTPALNIKVEKTDPTEEADVDEADDLQDLLINDQDFSDSDEDCDESMTIPVQNDNPMELTQMFDDFLENRLLKDDQEKKDTSEDKERDERVGEVSDLQQRKLQEVEAFLMKENGLWKCKECKKLFQLKYNLRKHAEIHVKGLAYSCDQCEKIFSTRSKRSDHKHKYHRLNEEKDMKNLRTTKQNLPKADSEVEVDNSVTEPTKSDKKELNDLHQQALKEVESLVIEDSGGWKCKECGRIFSQRLNLLYHAETHVSGLYYPCSLCPKTFNTRSRLSQHRFDNHKEKIRRKNSKEENTEKRRKEPISKDGGLIPQDINREISEKIQDLVEKKSDTEWRCTRCSLTKTKLCHLVTHLETHLNYTHPCPQCGFSSRTRQGVRFHYSVTHKTNV